MKFNAVSSADKCCSMRKLHSYGFQHHQQHQFRPVRSQLHSTILKSYLRVNLNAKENLKYGSKFK